MEWLILRISYKTYTPFEYNHSYFKLFGFTKYSRLLLWGLKLWLKEIFTIAQSLTLLFNVVEYISLTSSHKKPTQLRPTFRDLSTIHYVPQSVSWFAILLFTWWRKGTESSELWCWSNNLMPISVIADSQFQVPSNQPAFLLNFVEKIIYWLGVSVLRYEISQLSTLKWEVDRHTTPSVYVKCYFSCLLPVRSSCRMIEDVDRVIYTAIYWQTV